jgi:hypothetical protein
MREGSMTDGTALVDHPWRHRRVAADDASYESDEDEARTIASRRRKVTTRRRAVVGRGEVGAAMVTSLFGCCWIRD